MRLIKLSLLIILFLSSCNKGLTVDNSSPAKLKESLNLIQDSISSDYLKEHFVETIAKNYLASGEEKVNKDIDGKTYDEIISFYYTEDEIRTLREINEAINIFKEIHLNLQVYLTDNNNYPSRKVLNSKEIMGDNIFSDNMAWHIDENNTIGEIDLLVASFENKAYVVLLYGNGSTIVKPK